MKRRICIMVVAVMVMLSACGSNRYYDEGYENGYSDGYADGRFDANFEHDEDYSRGYEDGYSDASCEFDYYGPEGYSDKTIEIIREIQREAESYSSEGSEYDIETAMVVVDCYLNNKPDDCGERYSAEDFIEASQILYRFYEYFYGRHYN